MKDRNSPLFILVAMITAIAALILAKSILLPISLAILLSFLLTPVADRLERWRIPRIPAVLSIVLLTFVVLGAIGWTVTEQVIDLGLQLPKHEEMLLRKIRDFKPESPTWQRVNDTISNLRAEVSKSCAAKPSGSPDKPAEKNSNARSKDREKAKAALETIAVTNNAPHPPTDDDAVPVKVVEMPPSPLQQAQDWLGPLVAPLTTGGMVIVLVLFILMDRENQRSRIVQLFGRSHVHATTEAIHDMASRVGRYLRTLFLINAGYGFAVATGLAIIGVPGALMWGVLGFSLRFLPYIGPPIAAVLPTLVAIATTDGWKAPILTAGWYIVVELIANNIVEPLVYGSTTGISTVGVIISAIFWTWLWGPIGLILAMPMTVCLLVATRYVPQLKFINTLLADHPAATPGERIYQRLLAFDDREPTKLALKHVKDSSLAGFYDDMLLPALVMFEHDRHGDLLNDEQSAFVLEAAEDLVTDLGTSEYRAQEKQRAQDAKDDAATGDVVSGPATQPVRVLCIPLHDDADEIASRMLVQLLTAEGFQAESGAAESLTAELVDQVAESESDIVVISVLPPIAPRDSRLLWRRLRSRYPTLPIVVGFWTAAAQKEALAEPVEDAASKVATTLAEAVAFVRSMSAQVQHPAKTA